MSYTISPVSFSIFEHAKYQGEAERTEATIGADAQMEQCAQSGDALSFRGQFAEAISQYRRAIALGSQSNLLPRLWSQLAAALAMDGQVADALKAFDTALSLSPGDHNARVYVHRALALLKSGDLNAGWAQYEWRRKLPEWRGVRLSQIQHWCGEELQGRKIVLLTEQGLGDCIQFIRYAPLLARRGAHVFVGCAYNPELRRLFASIEGVCGVYGIEHRNIKADYQCYLMSLPLHMGTTLDTIPANVPYITADAVGVAQRAQQLGAQRGLRVGLVWAGGRKPELTEIDLRRSMSLTAFAPLFEVADVEWFSLQKDVPAADSGRPNLLMAGFPPEVTDFWDVASLVANLDLVISVDTAIAHLAGAMGKPVWLLSRYDACWRWLLDRDDTPWYPTMRLFRQPTSGDWESAMFNVRTALSDAATRWRATRGLR